MYISPACVYIVVKNAVLLMSCVNTIFAVFWPCTCSGCCRSQPTSSKEKKQPFSKVKGRGRGGRERERAREEREKGENVFHGQNLSVSVHS